MASDSQPYKYSISKPDYYSFITDNRDEYECYFFTISGYFPNHPSLAPKFFGFNLDLITKPSKTKGIDKRIADTVVTIVGDFLNSKINAVVYVCDTSDGKGSARARKFKSWFDYADHASHQIMKLSTDTNAGGMTLYTALLVHQKNKLKKQFIQAYLELLDVDDEDK